MNESLQFAVCVWSVTRSGIRMQSQSQGDRDSNAAKLSAAVASSFESKVGESLEGA